MDAGRGERGGVADVVGSLSNVSMGFCAMSTQETPLSRFAWIRRQRAQVKAGGWPVVWRKLHLLTFLAFGLLGALLLRLLRPVIRVRLGQLRVDRIGHLSVEPVLYLCQQRYAPLPRVLDLLYFQRQAPVCNTQLFRMVARTLPIVPWAYWLDRAQAGWPDAAQHRIDFSTLHRDVHGWLAREPSA